MKNIENVTPTPKWHFLAKKWLVITAFVASIALGALTVTGIIFSVANVGFAYYRLTHDTFIGFLIDAAPFLWIISTILLFASAYATFRNTKAGYKYPILYIVGGVSAGSLVLGLLFFTLGVGQILEEHTRKFSPLSSPLERIEARWNNPEEGRLAGKIITIDSEEFELEDVSGMFWDIPHSNLIDSDLRILTINKRFRILGIYSDNTFTACAVLPWNIHGSLSKQRMLPARAHFERKLEQPRISTCEEVRSHIPLPLRRTQ